MAKAAKVWRVRLEKVGLPPQKPNKPRKPNVAIAYSDPLTVEETGDGGHNSGRGEEGGQ